MSKHFLEMDVEELRADCLHLEKVNAALLAAAEEVVSVAKSHYVTYPKLEQAIKQAKSES